MAATPPRRRRRFLKLLIAGTSALLAVVLALPWLASTASARRAVVAAANRSLAPSRLEVSGVQLSWLGSQQARGVVIRDRAGKTLASAERLTIGRSLVGLAAARAFRGTVTVEGASFDIERRRDGSIDLVDALGPLIGGGPGPEPSAKGALPSKPAKAGPAGPDLTVNVVRGSLVVRAPELVEPLRARRVDATVRIPPSPGSLAWRVLLADPADGDEATLEVQGDAGASTTPGASPEIALKLMARRWPWAIATGGVVARGRLDGSAAATCRSGLWGVSGDASVLGLDAAGPALAGDRLRLDRVRWTCDAVQAAGSWDVRHLAVDSPVGSLKAGGTVASAPAGGGTATRLEGHLDLAALARQLPHALRLRDGVVLERGLAAIEVELRDAGAGHESRLAVDARVSDLVAGDHGRRVAIREPATLRARLVRQAGDLHVETLAVKTGFLDASGAGDLRKGVRLEASVDLEGLKGQLRDVVDFGTLDVAGRGRLAADYRRAEGNRYSGRLAAEFRGLRVAGVGPRPVARDAVRLDVAASGPLAESGLPGSWSQARLVVKADGDSADARLSTATTDGAFQIDGLQVALIIPTAAPESRPAGAETVRFAARGRFDPGAGLLELRPMPGAPASEPLALAPEGVRIVGLNRGGDLSASGVLTGDLRGLDRAVAAWTGSAPAEVGGKLAVRGSVTLKGDGALALGAAVQVPDLSLAEAEGPGRRAIGTVALGVEAARAAGTERIDIRRAALACPYANLDLTGSLDDPQGQRRADLSGTVVPNWGTLDRLVAESIEPGARVRGAPRPFRVRGPLAGDGLMAILGRLDAELAVDRLEAVAFGLRMAPAPLVVHWRGKEIAVEPIATTVNGGRALLRPGGSIDDRGNLTLRLASGSTIEGAEINDEVSRSLLAYVAPVLHDATQVRGKVSVRVDRAEFPVVGEATSHSVVVGRVEFVDVVCAAGPFAGELLGLAGRKGTPALRLSQPVELAIADGRVNQRGLVVPIGRDARLELEGSVGFDRTLAMRARVPVSPQALGARGGELDEVLEGLKVGVPIGGTLAHPTIDRRALRVGLKDAGKSALKRGAADLLRNLSRPEPGGPPGRPPGRRP